MATAVEIDGKKPGKVQNRQIIAKTRAVVTKFDPPITWDDLTTDGFSQDLIDRYEVTLRRDGVDIETQSGKGTRYVWPMTKAEAALSGYGFRAKAIIEDLEAGEEDAAVGSVQPEPIIVDFTEITGSIDYSQSGSLGMSRYGTEAQMNASPAKDGDIWINTSYFPTRVYRRVQGAWVYQVAQDIIAGQLIADAVVAGAIDGHTIVGAIIIGGVFRTMDTGQYVELATGSQQHKVRFMSDGIERGNISLIGTGGQMATWADSSWIIGADEYVSIDTIQFHLLNQSVNSPGVVNNDTAGVNLIPEGSAGGHRPATWIPIYLGGSSPANATLVYIPAFKTTTGAA